jgi:hypothetical protein
LAPEVIGYVGNEVNSEYSACPAEDAADQVPGPDPTEVLVKSNPVDVLRYKEPTGALSVSEVEPGAPVPWRI